MSGIVPASAASLAALGVARDFAARSMSDATVRAYQADWTHFSSWCALVGVEALPADPAQVAAYLASMAATHTRNTIKRRLSAISQRHRLANLNLNLRHRDIVQTLKGMWHAYGRPDKQALPIGVDVLTSLVATCDESARGVRDRAMLLLGFAGALRRSEIVALHVDDVPIGPEGIRLRIRRSKTDQAGDGAEIGIPRGQNEATCPVRAVSAWLELLGCSRGPLFRGLSKAGRLLGERAMSGQVVEAIITARARSAGLVLRFTPHGLRAGFITAASSAGVRDDDGMQHSRHTDLKVYRGYVRRARALVDSPAGMVGL
jgi:site-specific recombinase XerD